MDQLHELLQSIDLSPTEATIYLTGLSFNSIDANDLARQTGIKRPTVYHALSTLVGKGLVSKRNSAGKTHFSMTNPALLSKFVEQQIFDLSQKRVALDNATPLFAQLKPNKHPSAFVSHYEGIAGIKLLMEELYYCRSHHWDAIAPRNNFFLQFDKNYTRYFLETRTKRGITARTLWEKGIDEIRGRSLTPAEITERNPRYLPKEMWGKFQSTMYLFDGKVAFISSMQELSAILIQSDDVFSTHKAMFDALWNISTPYND